MRTTINLHVIILALAAWAAASPTILGNKPELRAEGSFILDRPSYCGDHSSPQLVVISTCSESRG